MELCDNLFSQRSQDEKFLSFRFEDLVFDVQAYIVAFFIPPQDLLSLRLVSRHINSLATPALYSDVRLLYGLKAPSRSSRFQESFTASLSSSQKAFAEHILLQRDRARHVRSLAWQVYGTSGPSGSAFTDLFPLLDNLTKIHFVDAHPTQMHDINLAIPPLFPRLKDVKITGTTSLSFIMPVLHSPHRLTALSLDTVNPHFVTLHLLLWISTAELSNLRTFSLRTMCQSWSAQTWNELREREILAAWRTALSAVRHTVEEVTLGFREQLAVGRDASLPSTERFAELVMPVFWEEQWPQLRALKLEGIDIDGVGMTKSTARLRTAIPGVIVDKRIHYIQRVWHSEVAAKF